MPPTLVFDLDGTLVDTAADLVATLNVVLAGDGLRPLAFDDARSMVGHGARVLIERGLATNGTTRGPADIDRLFDSYIAYYAAHIADHSRPFPGAVAAIDRFRANGWTVAVCTNKLEGLSRLLLESLGIAGRFAAICGADTFSARKPDPIALRGTIERAGGDPASAVMVGDSITDIDTARAAGIPVVAVDFGYTPIPPAELGADILISHFDALDEAVAAVRGGR